MPRQGSRVSGDGNRHTNYLPLLLEQYIWVAVESGKKNKKGEKSPLNESQRGNCWSS